MAVHSEDEVRLRERHALVKDVPMSRCIRSGAISRRPYSRRSDCFGCARGRKAGPCAACHDGGGDPILAANKDIATVETTPQHLTLVAPECYQRLGHVRADEPADPRGAPSRGAVAGDRFRASSIASAPTMRRTRARRRPSLIRSRPRALPGVQTLLPLLLDHMNAGRLTLERLIDLTSTGPARLYALPARAASPWAMTPTLTLVDLKARRTIRESWIASRCGWTPFDA